MTFFHPFDLSRWVSYRKRNPIHVIFTVSGVSVVLNPQERTVMSTSVSQGQTLPMSLAFLDQNGNPITPTPTPDSPPAWNATPDIVTASTDGLTASLATSTVGTDAVNVSVTVAGKVFTAVLDVTVGAPVLVLTSVQIVPGTPT